MTQTEGNMHVVVGLGKTGLSCARHLQRQGLPFFAVDTRPQPPGLAEFQAEFADSRVECGELRAEMLAPADVIVLSPGVDGRHPLLRQAREQGKRLTGDIDLFARVVEAPLVAITGSNAKTTVTTLVGEMARAAGIR